MSDTESTGNENAQPSPEEIERHIEETREQLAETVDALGSKLDVKSRVKQSASDARDQAAAKVGQARDAVTDDDGRPDARVLVVAGAVVAGLVVAGIVVWRRR